MQYVIAIAVVVIIVIWLISTQRRLAAMDENVNNAMSQIGVQLQSRFDALTSLLELTKGYNAHESETLAEVVRARRSVITGTSSAGDVDAQENLITEAMGKINAIAEQYPDLKANTNYNKTIDSVNSYEQSVRASRLIYNDSVTKLNRSLRMFPTSLVGGMFGFKPREYLAADQSKADMPSMK